MKNIKKDEQGFIVILIPIIIIVIVLIVIFSGGGNKDEDTQTNNGNSDNTSQTISENDAEKYCQDAALLGKYLDMDKVSVIDMANYNKQYIESGDKDENGGPIMMLTWNGKMNNETAGFTCMVSGNKDDIKLHLLSVNGTDFYNTMDI